MAVTITTNGIETTDVDGGALLPNAKAWVNFIGTAADISLYLGHNISSVTRSNTGRYSVTFSNFIGNYPPAHVCGELTTAFRGNPQGALSYGGSQIDFICTGSTGNFADAARYVFVAPWYY